MPRWCVAALIIAMGVVACRRPAPPNDDGGTPDPDTLYREQERVARGEKVGDELTRPHLALDAGGVTLNGRKVLEARELPGELRRIEPLRERLQNDRVHWQAIHPGEPFPGVAAVTIDPGVAAAPALSILISVASPFQQADVTSGGASFHARFRDVPKEGDAPWQSFARVEMRKPEGATLRFEGTSGCVSARRPRELGTAGALAAAFEEICPVEAGKCADLVVVRPGEGAGFGEMARVVQAVLGTASFVREPPVLDFEMPPQVVPRLGEPCMAAGSAALQDAPDSGAGLPPRAHLRPGVSQVDGAPHPEVFGTTLSENLGGFRACYARSLPANPNLIGRVKAKLVVSRGGTVVAVSNAGSDAPDGRFVRCVVGAFGDLTFPPQEGVVTVVAFVNFSPGNP